MWRELADLLDSRTLRNHAEAILADAYQDARRVAVAETEPSSEVFPAACPDTVVRLTEGD